ncbi:hypothetical protein BDQ17DRAFT_1356051 [Cyathus striatus]|nr:hypothetical protein BDQ17DRAFT_1356051 [Cyathus striatus]
MWEMSQPGSDAKECFLHITQTEYCVGDPGTDAADESMPDVSIYSTPSLTRRYFIPILCTVPTP